MLPCIFLCNRLSFGSYLLELECGFQLLLCSVCIWSGMANLVLFGGILGRIFEDNMKEVCVCYHRCIGSWNIFYCDGCIGKPYFLFCMVDMFYYINHKITSNNHLYFKFNVKCMDVYKVHQFNLLILRIIAILLHHSG